MTTLRFAVLMLALALPAATASAQSGTGPRLGNAERRLNAIDPQPAGVTLAQATDSQRLDAIERRLDALEQRMGSTRQAQQPSQPMPPSAAVQAPGAAAPQASPAPTAAVQLPSGAVQQVPAATAAAAAATAAATPVVPAASATYRSLGLHKGMTEAEVIKLLGPPVKITRGYVDVLFYSKDSIEPNVNIQYGYVIGWHD
jgi:hypothetical protein